MESHAGRVPEDDEGPHHDYIQGYADPELYFQTLLKKLVYCTQKSNVIVSSEDDHEFWSSYQEFSQFCFSQANRLQEKIVDILHHQCVPCSWSKTNRSSVSLVDVEEKFEQLVEANDALLERVDYKLDEAAGLRKDRKPIMSPHLAQGKPMVVSAWNKKAKKSANFKLLLATNIERPQLQWMDTIDNSSAPFVSILHHKPNALKPWTPVKRIGESVDKEQEETKENDDCTAKHPYGYELWVFEPAEWQLKDEDTQAYEPIENTTWKFIKTRDELEELNSILKRQKELAIDLEAHSYRSFLGFVCLMQISTREQDFLIDTFELRKDMHILNDVFTDPSILKVMHGADMDIVWLQRDFGLYIVNLFDTGQAARVLGLARFSLAFLLYKYCGVVADKQYQLADWRMRPLPDEMIKYAIEDTHYLLYIKDRMRNELLRTGGGAESKLLLVYSNSKAVASKIYQKPIYTPDSYQQTISKYKRPLNRNQVHCFKLLHAWRDKVAREEDESTGYVLPNHMILKISENLPREPQGIIACCNPVPPLVNQRSMEIHVLVEEARNLDFTVNNASKTYESSQSATAVDFQVSREVPELSYQSWREGITEIPHKELKLPECLKSGFDLFPVTGPTVLSLEPVISWFANSEMAEVIKTKRKQKANSILASFTSPFDLVIGQWKAEHHKIISEEDKGDTRSPTKNLKRTTHEKDDKACEEEPLVSLRDMLPSKKKKKIHDIRKSGSDRGSGGESSSELLSYEKTKKARSFVRFDYAKTDA